ncbi:MAG: HEAT repeat domain-containing protein [Rubripirellula sp.]|nr:HEAT repeat domain-containing protein [Rubripirellula sp.]
MRTIRIMIHLMVILAACYVLPTHSVMAADPTASSEIETSLIEVLRSEASPAEKAIACKKLAVNGTSQAVPELAELLPNEQLSSWARIALEAIPGEESSKALRAAAESLDGRLQVGMINSIGARQDSQAVELLITHLQDEDAEVASAAAVALGKIGGEPATKSLRQALKSAPADVRSAVAEGCILCAERLHASGDSATAVEVYDEICSADVPQQRIIEATRGAILARDQDGIPMLMETFRSPDKKMFQLALGIVREFPGSEVDQAVADELAKATPQRAALMIQAMADRPDTVLLAEVLKAATEGDKLVRMSAIDALRRVGDPSCLAPLMNAVSDDDAELASAAKQTLADLPGDNVDPQIVAMLPGAKGENYKLLLDLIGQRRIAAVEEVVKALGSSDPAVRKAALVALGETVKLDRLSVLVTQAVSPKYPEDASEAQKALRVASIRMPDREACATQLAKAMQQSKPDSQVILLETISEVGGSKALQILADAAKSDRPGLQDNGSRLLGKWNGVDAAPVLLDLAKTGPAEKYRIRALRGYIGIARKFPMPEPQRVKMCQQAMDAAKRIAEQQLVLDVLKIHPSQAGLNLANQAKQTPELKEQATATAQAIAAKLKK